MSTCRLLHGVAEAAQSLTDRKIIAIPTETVYGLACRADDDDAMRKVFAAKARPSDHPLILHVAPEMNIEGWALFSDSALTLANEFWPGPLTILVARGALTSDVVTGGRDTVAVRMPSHVLAQEVIRTIGIPVVAPSANSFGHVSPTCAQHVIDDLGNVIDGVLDGGPCDIGVESTIVDCTTSPPQVLRVGAVSRADIERVLNTPMAEVDGKVRAPGMLASHYSPNCSMHLATSRVEAETLAVSLRKNHRNVAIIDHVDNITEYARCLYSDMRSAAAAGADDIIAVLPTGEGLAEAIRDRLSRAAA
ncbi:MAG: threonylcarbamoyl-AMP synthase [Actinobacteria bacterium]|nr:threonylcarbamoyl-AMP synthase [Actinomycetota bacterium]